MKRLLGSVAITLMSSAVFAQSISVEDLRAQIDARVGGLNEYQELLNDPDPARSMAAMEIMMASGDAALVKMAKDVGIFSPNSAVRKAALDGYFASGPVLELQFDATDASRQDSMGSDMKWYSGSVSSELIGFAQVQIGDLDTGKQCFGAVGFNDNVLDAGCFLRNSENGVSLYLWAKWWNLVLNDQGALVGSGGALYTMNLPISIQIAQ